MRNEKNITLWDLKVMIEGIEVRLGVKMGNLETNLTKKIEKKIEDEVEGLAGMVKRGFDEMVQRRFRNQPLKF